MTGASHDQAKSKTMWKLNIKQLKAVFKAVIKAYYLRHRCQTQGLQASGLCEIAKIVSYSL